MYSAAASSRNSPHKMTPPASSNNASKRFLESLQDALADGRFSDFKIICGPNEYKVHKVIITALSDYFTKAIKFGKVLRNELHIFTVQIDRRIPEQEAEDNEIILSHDDPDLVALMIHFIYQFDYSLATQSPPSQAAVPVPQVRHVARSFRPPPSMDLGTRVPYHLPVESKCPHGFQLPVDCPSNVAAHAPEHFMTHVDLYLLADKFMIPTLKEVCARKFKDCAHFYCHAPEFVDAIERAFHGTLEFDTLLRGAIFEVFAKRMGLLKKQDIKDLDIYDDLTKGVLMKIGDQQRWW